MTEAAHRHVVGGPRADARQADEQPPHLGRVTAVVKLEPRPRPRPWPGPGSPVGDAFGMVNASSGASTSCSGVGNAEPWSVRAGGREARADRRDDPAADRASTRDGHLLTDDRPDGGLERVEAPRRPAARAGSDEHPERSIAAQVVGDRGRVGVEVEQATDAADGHREVGPRVELERGGDMRCCGVQLRPRRARRAASSSGDRLRRPTSRHRRAPALRGRRAARARRTAAGSVDGP